MAQKDGIVLLGRHADDNTADVAKTDYRRWRLLDERGRQTWHYLESDEELKSWPQSVADRYLLGLPTVCAPFLLVPFPVPLPVSSNAYNAIDPDLSCLSP
jgi:hypothetical protein